MVKAVTKAVFPVAGLGTRFLPATKAMPKEMLPIVDKPLIQYAVEEAMEAGIAEMVMVTAPGRSLIEDPLAPHPQWEPAPAARGGLTTRHVGAERLGRDAGRRPRAHDRGAGGRLRGTQPSATVRPN